MKKSNPRQRQESKKAAKRNPPGREIGNEKTLYLQYTLILKKSNDETNCSSDGCRRIRRPHHPDSSAGGGNSVNPKVFWDGGRIPDPAFRAYVLDKFDTDRDGRISRAEAEAVTEIDISGTWDDFSARKGVTSLEGIQYFPNLRKLICAANDIAALDLAQNRELEELDCCANSLTQLDLTQNTKLKKLTTGADDETGFLKDNLAQLSLPQKGTLEELYCGGHKLAALNLSGQTQLKTAVCCECSELTSLNLSGCERLKELICRQNKLSRLDLPDNVPFLEKLDCSTNALASFNIGECYMLRTINLSNNKLRQLDLTNAINLKELVCSKNELTSLNTKSCFPLKILECDRNKLRELDLSRNPRLTELDCSYNKIEELSIDYCFSLQKITCDNNPLSYFDFSDTELDYLCIPERIDTAWKYRGAKEPAITMIASENGERRRVYNILQQLDKAKEKQQADRAEEKQRNEAEAQQREAARAEAKQKAAEYKRQIMPYLASKDWEGADRFAAEALAERPEGDAFLYLVRAKAYFKQNLDFEVSDNENMTEYFRAYRSEAERLAELCRKSIVCDSSDGNEAYFYRGMAYIVLGRADDAAADFKRCARGNEALKAVCYYNIGTAYKNAGRYSPALEQFKLARQYYTAADKKEQCLQRIKECQQKIKDK